MEKNDYEDGIPPKLRKLSPNGEGITLGDFADIVTDETLVHFLARLANESDPNKETRTLWLRAAAKTLGVDYEELQKKLDLLESEPEEPVETEGTSLVFPDIMAGAAGSFAYVFSSHLESPKHFFYISYLTCLGNCITKRVQLISEISPQPRPYVVILGESADDRKSTAIDKTVNFFRDTLPNGSFLTCYGVGSAEGLQKKSVEGRGLLLVFDELKAFIGKCKIDSSVLLPCVNTLFESNRYESKTKKSEINIQDAYLSILAASTIQTYERCWDPAFTDIGFNNRLFLCPGKGKRRFDVG